MSLHSPLTPLTVGDAVDLGAVVTAAVTSAPVARANADGTVVYGTARSIGDEHGNFASNDVRDCFLRVTTTSGWDMFWPVSDLMAEVRSGLFVPNYRHQRP